MNTKLIKEELCLLLKKHSINIDELIDILDELFYEKYNGVRTSDNNGCCKNDGASTSSSNNSSYCNGNCSCNSAITEDIDIQGNNPFCEY